MCSFHLFQALPAPLNHTVSGSFQARLFIAILSMKKCKQMDKCYSTFAGRYVSDNKPDKEKTAIRLKTFFCCFELDIVGSMLHAIFDDDNSKNILTSGLFVGWTCLILGFTTSTLCASALSFFNLNCKNHRIILEVLYPVLEFSDDSCSARKSCEL